MMQIERPIILALILCILFPISAPGLDLDNLESKKQLTIDDFLKISPGERRNYDGWRTILRVNKEADFEFVIAKRLKINREQLLATLKKVVLKNEPKRDSISWAWSFSNREMTEVNGEKIYLQDVLASFFINNYYPVCEKNYTAGNMYTAISGVNRVGDCLFSFYCWSGFPERERGGMSGDSELKRQIKDSMECLKKDFEGYSDIENCPKLFENILTFVKDYDSMAESVAKEYKAKIDEQEKKAEEDKKNEQKERAERIRKLKSGEIEEASIEDAVLKYDATEDMKYVQSVPVDGPPPDGPWYHWRGRLERKLDEYYIFARFNLGGPPKMFAVTGIKKKFGELLQGENTSVVGKYKANLTLTIMGGTVEVPVLSDCVVGQ